MKVKELQEEIVTQMKWWQRMEDASLASTGRVMEVTENPVIRLAMEIIQRDSQMHHTVQGWIAKSLTNETVTLSPDELERVWGLIERHVEIENRMADAVKKLLPELKGKKMVLQEYLLQYLLDDEAKHANLLKRLETIKKGMLP
jgi:hypothetical protein